MIQEFEEGFGVLIFWFMVNFCVLRI